MPLASSSVTVTTTATLLTGGPGIVHVRPIGGDVYIGGAGVTAAAGMLLSSGEVYDDRLTGSEADSLYAITASGSVPVRVLVNGL